MNELNELFNQDTINYYKTHKEKITLELLDTLRSKGKQGKQIALDILDTEKTHDNYYLDAYGNKIAFLGDREVKRAFTPMKLYPIHEEELKRCSESLDYFRENYIKIRTKDGIDFPDMRPYQKGFLDALMSDYESIVSLQPRQSGKSVTTAIYLVWKFNFDHDKNIGICANNGGLAREFLNNVRNMFYGMPMWMRVGVTVWNKSSIESENKMRILTDGPSQSSFRGYTISILVVDETAFISPTVFREFIDSVAPSQSALAWKKNLFISTANGLNHFYELVQGAKRRKEYKFIDEEEKNRLTEKYKDKVLSIEKNYDMTYNLIIDVPSNGMLYYEVNWRDVPRYNSKGEQISPEDFRESVIDKYGLIYFNQNYGGNFIGSSYTLIDAEALKELVPKDPELIWDERLDIFVEPQEDHEYIMGVDPAKGGLDAFAIQILDITSFPFVQVASAQLFKCNYQLMPEFINEWGKKYNNAYLIIENNEGAGTFIATMLHTEYEYENMYFQKKYLGFGSTGTAKEPGFRTTTKTRTQILETFKFFVDNHRLKIFCNNTINELFTFIIKNNKYQADDGCHDDMIMALCLCFVPFIDTRNFEDMKDLVKKLYSNEDMEDMKLLDYMVIGDFDTIDDSTEESLAGKKFDSEFEYSYDYYSNH